MKLVKLFNKTKDVTVTITQIPGLTINPGTFRMVHPATVSHPAVRLYIPKILQVCDGTETEKVSKPVENLEKEPIAPKSLSSNVSTIAATEKDTPVTEKSLTEEPVFATTDPSEGSASLKEQDGETSGNLREEYLQAPGITSLNIDAIISKYPTYSDLKKAERIDLIDLGIAKNQIKRLLAWANKVHN